LKRGHVSFICNCKIESDFEALCEGFAQENTIVEKILFSELSMA